MGAGEGVDQKTVSARNPQRDVIEDQFGPAQHVEYMVACRQLLASRSLILGALHQKPPLS